MEIPLKEVFHLEVFLSGDKKFIKDILNPARGNVTRWPGKKDYIFLPPETLVKVFRNSANCRVSLFL